MMARYLNGGESRSTYPLPLVDSASSWLLLRIDRTALNPAFDHSTGDSTGCAATWNVRPTANTLRYRGFGI